MRDTFVLDIEKIHELSDVVKNETDPTQIKNVLSKMGNLYEGACKELREYLIKIRGGQYNETSNG